MVTRNCSEKSQWATKRFCRTLQSDFSNGEKYIAVVGEWSDTPSRWLFLQKYKDDYNEL